MKESGIQKIDKLLSNNPKIILVHVTDTYFIEETTVNGTVDLPGFARFHSMIDHMRTREIVKNKKIPIILLHGGDFLYPSLMSVYFKGKQMIEILNLCQFNYCTLGNHDFDGGVKILKTRMSEASFEITCANINSSRDDHDLQISEYVICRDEQELPFAAIIGVAGRATLRKAIQNNFEIMNGILQTVAKIQKNFPKIKHLIVLSHMSNKEDLELEIWLDRNWNGNIYILGGHDHNKFYNRKTNKKSILLKGQSNCRTVQLIGISDGILKNSNTKNSVMVMNSDDLSKFYPSLKIKENVLQWELKLKKHLGEPCSDRIVKKFEENIVLDATELSLRKGSTNFGNFIADSILNFSDCDIVFINSGHFRGDRKIGCILRLSDLRRIFVLDKKDSLVKITMTKKECLEFLNHAFSEEGRGKILQVSKNSIKIIQNSKPEDQLLVTMLWDMLVTDDDGFTTILAQSRRISVDHLLSELKQYRIPNSSICEVVENSSKYVEYDPDMRASVVDFNKYF